jgi:hypothetical protein
MVLLHVRAFNEVPNGEICVAVQWGPVNQYTKTSIRTIFKLAGLIYMLLVLPESVPLLGGACVCVTSSAV